MFALTTKLITGSGVDAGSHPILVSLLELAAQKPGLSPDVPDLHALRKRLERQWGAVCAAFRAFVAVAGTDADIVAALPRLSGLTYREGEGWRITAEDLLSYRGLVAEALVKVAGSKLNSLQPFAIKSIGDLRKAQKRNHLPSLTAPIFESPGHVETPLIEGRGVVVSWPLFGLRLFASLVADEHGRMTAIAFADAKKDALEAFNRK